MASGLDDMINIKNMINIETDSGSGIPISDNGRLIIKSNYDNLPDHEEIGDGDEVLSKILQRLKTRTVVFGVGGAGNNAISRLQDVGVHGALTIAVNTDAQDLFYANSDRKLLIGKEITSGLGAGNDPKIGELSAEKDLERIRSLVNKDIVFITCGLGGGTGTGAAPIIAREAKKNGALVISYCTLPFKMEGEEKRIVAQKGLVKLAKYSDTIIPIPNESLLKLVPNLSLMKGFKIMDEILIRSVKGVVDLVSNCGLINLDLADVKAILKKRENSTGIIGMSEISMENFRDYNGELKSAVTIKQILREKTIKALKNPLLNPEISRIKSCLISITGNQNLSLAQVNEIVGTISENIEPESKLKFGAMIDPNAESITITLIGLGPKSPYLIQAEHIKEDLPNKTIVEFIL